MDKSEELLYEINKVRDDLLNMPFDIEFFSR